eukprot:GHRR01025188.1.p2 GENE.GHRR01025188.1~~GHRR01025188.1.p2  ORF type:complete len:117 (-),score=40.03 GHRR01025188.1:112-462(-)
MNIIKQGCKLCCADFVDDILQQQLVHQIAKARWHHPVAVVQISRCSQYDMNFKPPGVDSGWRAACPANLAVVSCCVYMGFNYLADDSKQPCRVMVARELLALVPWQCSAATHVSGS